MKTLIVKKQAINIALVDNEEYISLTDIARYKNTENPKGVIQNWIRNRNTIEFLGIWELIHNPNFKGIEFEAFKKEAGLNSFTLAPQKWIEATNAVGLVSKSGKGGGTYAHRDIAFEIVIKSVSKSGQIKQMQYVTKILKLYYILVSIAFLRLFSLTKKF